MLCSNKTLFTKTGRRQDLAGLQVEVPNRICGSGILMRDKMEFARDSAVFDFSYVSLLEILGRGSNH